MSPTDAMVTARTQAVRATPSGRSSSGMSDLRVAGRWQNYNSQHRMKASWEEHARLSLLWLKSRPDPAKMLLASQAGSASKKKMELSRWKRLSRKLNLKVIPVGSFEEHGPALGSTQSRSQPFPTLRFLTFPPGASLPGLDYPRANTALGSMV